MIQQMLRIVLLFCQKYSPKAMKKSNLRNLELLLLYNFIKQKTMMKYVPNLIFSISMNKSRKKEKKKLK